MERMNNMSFYETISQNAKTVEEKLAEKLDLIKSDGAYEKYGVLEQSMRYSLMAGGKRLRPCLVIEFAKLFGAPA